jgi:hypothetical protein
MKEFRRQVAYLLIMASLIGCSKKNDTVESEIIKCPLGFCEKIQYGSGVNQWFNLYTSNSGTLSPVYVWAHPNGASLTSPGTAYSFSDKTKNDLVQAGINIISWESTPQVQTEADLTQTETDFIALYKWIEVNGKKYNLDITKIVSGGRSRGTWASWPGTQTNTLNIKGFFGVQAFPQDGWLVRRPQNLVTTSSPPIFLTYDEAPGTTDGHKPEYGIIVQNEYIKKGIGYKTSLYHSLAEKNLYDSLIPFIKRVTN